MLCRKCCMWVFAEIWPETHTDLCCSDETQFFCKPGNAASRCFKGVYITSLLLSSFFKFSNTESHMHTHAHTHTHRHEHYSTRCLFVSLVCNEHCMANNSTSTLSRRSHLQFTVQTKWKKRHTNPKHNQLWGCSDECCISINYNRDTHTHTHKHKEPITQKSFKFHSQILTNTDYC